MPKTEALRHAAAPTPRDAGRWNKPSQALARATRAESHQSPRLLALPAPHTHRTPAPSLPDTSRTEYVANKKIRKTGCRAKAPRRSLPPRGPKEKSRDTAKPRHLASCHRTSPLAKLVPPQTLVLATFQKTPTSSREETTLCSFSFPPLSYPSGFVIRGALFDRVTFVRDGPVRTAAVATTMYCDMRSTLPLPTAIGQWERCICEKAVKHYITGKT